MRREFAARPYGRRYLHSQKIAEYTVPVTSKKGVIGIGVPLHLLRRKPQTTPQGSCGLFVRAPVLAARTGGRKVRRFSQEVPGTPTRSSCRPRLASRTVVVANRTSWRPTMALAPSHALTVGDVTVHEANGLYSLNDLHAASGGEPRHRPSRWVENRQTQELAQEIGKAGIPALVVQKGGTAPGVYACRELVIAFAAWISAAFHLKVIRVFLAVSAPPQVAPLPANVPLAFALATEAGSAAQREVFNAVSTGDDDWLYRRFLLSMAYGADGKPDRPAVKVLPKPAFVATVDDFPTAQFSNAELATVIATCSKALAGRTCVPPRRMCWTDEPKARALMESMRLRREIHRVDEIVPPEKIIELHRRGLIGPRQFAKFRELMA